MSFDRGPFLELLEIVRLRTGQMEERSEFRVIWHTAMH